MSKKREHAPDATGQIQEAVIASVTGVPVSL